jgi:putative transposase
VFAGKQTSNARCGSPDVAGCLPWKEWGATGSDYVPRAILLLGRKDAAAARLAEAGGHVAEIVRLLDISEATFYVLKKHFDRVEALDIDELGQLRDDMRDENAHDTKRLDPPAPTRYSDEEIAAAVRRAEAGVPVPEIVRKLGISEATFSVWVKRCEGVQTAENELRQLRDENARLKQFAADLALNRNVCGTCAEIKREEYGAHRPPSSSWFSKILQDTDERNLFTGFVDVAASKTLGSE